MPKHLRNQLLVLIIITILHLVFSLFYTRLYGYFNLKNQLTIFTTMVSLIRLFILAGIAILGYFSLKQKKGTIFFLALFLFNLAVPYLF